MVQRGKVDRFEVIFEPEEERGYHVFCPLLSHSYGKTKEEARQHIAEAIQLWLESVQELASAKHS